MSELRRGYSTKKAGIRSDCATMRQLRRLASPEYIMHLRWGELRDTSDFRPIRYLATNASKTCARQPQYSRLSRLGSGGGFSANAAVIRLPSPHKGCARPVLRRNAFARAVV